MSLADPLPQLRLLLDGYRSTALLYAAAKLQLADHLAAGPLSGSDLARHLSVDAAALERLLRGLAVLDLVREETGGCFSLTPLGAGLRQGAPGALHELALVTGEEHLPAWGQLLHSVHTGRPAFDHVFGQTPWEHRQQQPALGEAFNTWLAAQTAGTTRAILQAWDFSTARTVADIGGGHGGLLSGILAGHPALRGILFDEPHVVAAAAPALQKAGVADRCITVGGDFFAALPAGADVYLLKSVLHDWDDAHAESILRQCRAALPAGGRLLIIERLRPERAMDDPATIMLDLHMLAVVGGQERDAGTYRNLATRAGLQWHQTLPTSAGFHLMEFILPA